MNKILIQRLSDALENEAGVTIPEDSAKAVLEHLFEWIPMESVPHGEDVLVLCPDIQKAKYYDVEYGRMCFRGPIGNFRYDITNPVGWFPLPFAKYKPE